MKKAVIIAVAALAVAAFICGCMRSAQNAPAADTTGRANIGTGNRWDLETPDISDSEGWEDYNLYQWNKRWAGVTANDEFSDNTIIVTGHWELEDAEKHFSYLEGVERFGVGESYSSFMTIYLEKHDKQNVLDTIKIMAEHGDFNTHLNNKTQIILD